MVFGKSKEGRDSSPEDGRQEGGFPPRQMVQGNWQCADCGAEITELPFEPAPDRPIYCRECWRKRRDQRFNR